jgi:hypothetical protein
MNFIELYFDAPEPETSVPLNVQGFAPLLPNCPVCGEEMMPWGKRNWRRRGEASYVCRATHERADKLWRESDLTEVEAAVKTAKQKSDDECPF